MKKVISALLLVSMIAAMFVVGVSAADGTAITTADEFAAMTGDGKYYLANDITISASNENALAAGFVFDGNGKKITTTVSLFTQAAGTVKNLTIEGEIDGNASVCANPIAALTLDNVVNNASVTDSTKKNNVGGFVRSANVDVTFKNCTNNGTITSNTTLGAGGFIATSDTDGVKVTFENCKNTGAVSSQTQAAGFYAMPKNAVISFKNCVNEGTITGVSKTAEYNCAGGLVGKLQGTVDGMNAGNASITIEKCSNSGSLSAAGRYAGGMVAWVDAGKLSIKDSSNSGEIYATQRVGGILGTAGKDKNYTAYEVTGCTNTGKIRGGERVGGIIGNIYGQGNLTSERVAAGTCQYAVITNCINLGEVVSTKSANVGQIIGQQDSECLVMKYCIGAGKLSAEEGKTMRGVVCASSGEIMIGGERTLSDGTTKETTKGCDIDSIYIIENDGTTWFSNYTDADEACDCALDAYMAMADKAGDIIIVTADKLASGEVAYALNQAIGKDVFFQTIGTDKVPTLSTSSKKVIKDGDKYANDSAPVDPPVNPPAPPTGDEALVWVVALVVSAIGVCALVRRKEEL